MSSQERRIETELQNNVFNFTEQRAMMMLMEVWMELPLPLDEN